MGSHDDFVLIEQPSLPCPVAGLPPIEVEIKVPAGAEPTDLQRQLHEQIRAHLPELITSVLNALRTDWAEHYEIFNRPAQAIHWIAFMIPPWEGDDLSERDPDEDDDTVPGIDNFFWDFALGIDIPHSSGCDGTFKGLKLLDLTIHW